MKHKKQILRIALWVVFLLVACCAFPIYNFTKSFGIPIMGINLFLNIACYYELGKYEKMTFTEWKIGKIALLNLGVILLGMVLRYFLEFGEVSNIYNFTGPNIALHIAAAFTISMVSYLTSRQPT